jgi:hypothetical protein
MVDEYAHVDVALAKLQQRAHGEKSSVFEHISSMVAQILDGGGDEIDLERLSELVHKQSLDQSRYDGAIPAISQEVGKSAQSVLELFGCAYYMVCSTGRATADL